MTTTETQQQESVLRAYTVTIEGLAQRAFRDGHLAVAYLKRQGKPGRVYTPDGRIILTVGEMPRD